MYNQKTNHKSTIGPQFGDCMIVACSYLFCMLSPFLLIQNEFFLQFSSMSAWIIGHGSKLTGLRVSKDKQYTTCIHPHFTFGSADTFVITRI